MEKVESNICLACPGYCCQIFTLAHSPTKLRELLKIKDLSWRESAQKALKWFKYLPRPSNPMQHFYSCKKFDWTKKVCKVYEGRPECCSLFMCKSGEEGNVPKESQMYISQLKEGVLR